MKKLFTIFFLILFNLHSTSQIDRVHPPNWWIGHKNPNLQLLIKAEKINDYKVNINYPGVKITNIHNADSPNYIFLDLEISDKAKEGSFIITFTKENKTLSYSYKLRKKRSLEDQSNGFDSSDAIYLITPDRFANGNYENDIIDFLKERKIDRANNYARHGGDLKGIFENISYIKNMGFTSLWLNPVLINDMKEGSYHGYATTDYYSVDPRFGSMKEYIELSLELKKNNIKLIKDIIVNHCGLYHWWMDDLPFKDWLNFQENYLKSNDKTIEKNTVYSNHRRTTIQDIYASKSDYRGMLDGWFVPTMPDLNQKNKFLANYLIQNSLWWIETLNLSGIRQDTYPYAEKEFMSEWAGRIMSEYPKFNIVGEEWSYNPIRIAYWQDGNNNKDGYKSNLKSTMDFAMQKAIQEGILEEEAWNTGLIKIYENLANDFYYSNPESLLIFNDNHDMSRIHTQMKKDITKTKMAIGLMLVLPRIPQLLYGTEILMEDSSNPGDHGLIRSDFPGGWDNDKINAFSKQNLTDDQIEMQEYLKVLLNFRKKSKAIHIGNTIHFAPKNGVYLLQRRYNDEIVIFIINKNKNDVRLSNDRFSELNLNNIVFSDIHSGKKFSFSKTLKLKSNSSYILKSN
jgi:glycosidase